MWYSYNDNFPLSLGEQGIDVFNQEAGRRNICIALQQKIPSGANEETYIDVSFLSICWIPWNDFI